MKADLLALAAIALWGTLAPLGVKLTHLPPFLLTGLGLLVGSLIALPLSRFRLSEWRVPLPTLLVGIYGLFGFHFLLFMALRTAPAVEANLINYLWPLGMVVLAPLFLPGVTLHTQHVAAALIGFAGAAIAILGRGGSGEERLRLSDRLPAGAGVGLRLVQLLAADAAPAALSDRRRGRLSRPRPACCRWPAMRRWSPRSR
jgi:drug/metabolite transporter (DMT)-like permease